MTLETELRDRLASAAARADRWDDDWAAADAVIDRRRVERRHRAVGAVAAACAVVIGVLVPTVGGGLFADSSAPPAGGATPTRTTPAPATTAPGATPLGAGWNVPTRGSLAADSAFVRALGERAFVAYGPATDRHVGFAGDVDGRRWALVVGNLQGSGAADWFVGTAGAPADALVDLGVNHGQPGDGAAVIEQSGRDSSTVLVVARPGDRAYRAQVTDVPGRGSVPGDATEVPLTDGVASFQLAPAAGMVDVRVEREGRQVADQLVGFRTAGHSPADPEAVVALAGSRPLRGAGGPASALAVDMALDQVLGPTGLTVDQVHPVVLWRGPVATVDGTPDQAVVLALTLPTGQVVTSTAWGAVDGSVLPLSEGGAQPCGTSVHPAGTVVADLVVVAECSVGETIVQRRLVVTAPPSASQLQVESSTGLGAPQPLAGAAVLDRSGADTAVIVSGTGYGPVSVPIVSSNAPFSLDGK